MKLLLTNDDGIDAPGLEALEAAVQGMGEIVIVAPLGAHSGCGHRVTTGSAMRVEQRGPGRFAVEGTPADCVRLALHDLAGPVDWVLAGVNAGANLGADVYHSGTVAAVREGAFHGTKGIAFSHYHRRGLDLPWKKTRAWTTRILRILFPRPLEHGTFWNVNFPHPEPDGPDPPWAECPLDLSPLPVRFRRQEAHFHYEGNYHERRRIAGSDVDHCFRGRIAVSLLKLG
jgi:5'-nucleotidase